MLPDVGSMIVPPGLSRPVPLGRLDHRQPDAVLDRAARVEHLELGEDQRLAVGRAEVAGDAGEPDERRVADEVEDRLGVLHRARVYGRGRAGRPPGRVSVGRVSRPRSAVAVEPARPQQQPGQPLAQPPRMARAGRPSAGGAPRRPARGSPASASLSRVGELELLARARLRERRVRRRGRRARAAVVAGRTRERHPPAEVELLGAGHRERHDRGVGAHRDERPADAERPEAARAAR